VETDELQQGGRIEGCELVGTDRAVVDVEALRAAPWLAHHEFIEGNAVKPIAL
jgi:hypothetical protein